MGAFSAPISPSERKRYSDQEVPNSVSRSPCPAHPPKRSGAAARLLRATILRAMALGTALTLMASATTTSSAHAFAVPPEVGAPLPYDDICYGVIQSFFDAFYGGVQNRSAVWTADQAWRMGDKLFNFRAYDCGGPHQVRRTTAPFDVIDGAGNAAADAHTPCRDDGSYICVIRVEPEGYLWNTVPENNTPAGWIDLTGILVHEMGHWAGLKHSCDHPGSDGGARPSMFDPNPCGGTVLGGDSQRVRTISADDVNGLNIARPNGGVGSRDILANGNFDYQGLGYTRGSFTDPGWGGYLNTGWGKLGGNWVDRNCVHGPAQGPCFMALGPGAGQSIYQDLAVWDGNYIRGMQLRPRVALRSPFGPGSGRLVVWNLETGGALYIQDCNLPGGPGWVFCGPAYTFNEPPGTWIRFEIYNTSNTNLDIDAATLAF